VVKSGNVVEAVELVADLSFHILGWLVGWLVSHSRRQRQTTKLPNKCNNYFSFYRKKLPMLYLSRVLGSHFFGG
jgi:hypothetical protein